MRLGRFKEVWIRFMRGLGQILRKVLIFCFKDVSKWANFYFARQ